jgi:thioredoxin reductase (NADPH)
VRGDRLTASRVALDKVNEPSHAPRLDTIRRWKPSGQNSKLKTLKIRNTKTGEKEELHPAAAFIFIGQLPNTPFKDYAELDLAASWMTGHDIFPQSGKGTWHQTRCHSRPRLGILPGDVRHGSTKQVASAVGEGAAASISIREFLRRSEGMAVG